MFVVKLRSGVEKEEGGKEVLVEEMCPKDLNSER